MAVMSKYQRRVKEAAFRYAQRNAIYDDDRSALRQAFLSGVVWALRDEQKEARELSDSIDASKEQS